MNRIVNPGERLVVALDPPPEVCEFGVEEGKRWVIDFAHRIKGTGVVVKVGALLSACGFGLVNELREMGFPVFADLKLNDTLQALRTYGRLLSHSAPQMLTMHCGVEKDAVKCLRTLLPATELLGVTILTTAHAREVQRIYRTNPRDMVVRLAGMAYKAGFDGVVCAPAEIIPIRRSLQNARLSLVTPGVRLENMERHEHDPFRAMTAGGAIASGATRVVVGRPIIDVPDPIEMIEAYVREIATCTNG